MREPRRWRDSGHLERAVETAVGQEGFSVAVGQMNVSIARISQIENGDVSTQDVLQRYITALGGTLELIVDFGDEQLKIA
jgi:hypothetical protein